MSSLYIKKQRIKAFKRAENKCEVCGNEESKLEIHHIDGWSQNFAFHPFGMEENHCQKHNHSNNLLVICKSCHKQLHTRIYEKAARHKSEDESVEIRKFNMKFRKGALVDLLNQKPSK